MNGPNWLREADCDEAFNRAFLLDLYKTYQDRQLSDLRLLYNYTNFYAAALSGLLTAFVVALVKASSDPLAALLAVLPLSALLLIHNGRITAWRFYRRYTEGRVRLTKIEYSIGLDKKLPVKSFEGKKPFLWWKDSGFLPPRCFRQADSYEDSTIFVLERSRHYGIGVLTQKMFSMFGLFAWVGIFTVPISLAFLAKLDWVWILSVVVSSACSAVGVLSWCRYEKLWKHMIDDLIVPEKKKEGPD